ncbi:unnamed protein product [Diabrotica balteata]|uniref:Cytochrome P450 n=1 Tax=Diabrotica balteata TaxID=107213 RepID=A0A9N9SLE0_DIABA|nr:unnamed protein product [Diabrotica balteata]
MTAPLLVFFIVCIFLYYLFFIKPMNYWKEKKVFHLSALRSFLRTVISGKSFYDATLDLYRKYPSRRYFGNYLLLKPTLFVRDLDLIKAITIKDFEHFTDHFTFFQSDPILGNNLFELQGERWKDMRSTLSPAFTSAKMKGMYTFIEETAKNFTQHLYDMNAEEIEFKKEFTMFSNDVIATCAFGINCDSFNNENNEFFSMGTELITPSPRRKLTMFFALMFPKIFKAFGIPIISQNILNFFKEIVKENIETREKHNIFRPDMIHLLMEAKRGRLKFETNNLDQDDGYAVVQESTITKSIRQMEITDNIITAQAVVFLIGGLDTNSTTLALMSHQLAIHQDIQRRLQQEVDEVFKQCDGKLTYEVVLRMKYLDQVISEVLRRYPLGYAIMRKCVKDYKIESYKRSESTFILEKGASVTIPIVGIHMDPLLFPDPEKFDPDRFSDENRKNIVPGSYMPFGSGPRNCIGSRFAVLECKTVMVCLLRKFDIVPTKNTRNPLRFKKNITVSSRDGFWLGLRKRKH